LKHVNEHGVYFKQLACHLATVQSLIFGLKWIQYYIDLTDLC